MKKRKIIVSVIGIIFVISIVVKIYELNKNITFKDKGVIYAVNVNGQKQNSFPVKGLYKVETTCENAEGKWDYNNWQLYIENITGIVSCNISFTTISKTYLNNKIISLSGTTQGTGKIVNEKGYRYEGKDPNNYIWFNNELWRIIGVFDSSSHGQTGQNLVKIIREESIGGLVRDTSNFSNWNTSSLKLLLNGAYYNKTNGTNSGYCYGFSEAQFNKKIPSNCDYSTKGIDSVYKSMVKNVTWYLGGNSDNSTTTEAIYNAERGTNVYSGNPTSTTGYIGLIYASDYGYSVLANSCARTTNLSSYNTAACAGQSWLCKGDKWTITPTTDKSNAFYVSNDGMLLIHYKGGFDIHPVLYLDSSVYVLDGDGSILDPYIIAM